MYKRQVYKSDDTEEYYFSGKRIHRGQYRTARGQVLNADVNGALNILRKSSIVDANIVYTVETKWTRNKNTEY